MAAQEEKISGKRRKLFKALSAAPAVVTLSPGSALATDSAFQCALKIADSTSDPNLTQPGPVVTEGFVNTTLIHWVIAEGEGVDDENGDPIPCSIDSSIEFIVEIAGEFYDNANPGVPTSLKVERTATDSDVLEVSNSSDVVCMTIAGKPGDFAVLGAISSDGESFEALGVYPQRDPDVDNGITATCMTSLVEAGKFIGLSSS